MKQLIENFYSCENCEFQTKKWLGSCPQCKNWDCIKIFQKNKNQTKQNISGNNNSCKIYNLNEVSNSASKKIATGIEEFDRVLGEGLTEASFNLISGEPGIGKSTLLLQISTALAKHGKIIYFSTEESLTQIKARAVRLNLKLDNLNNSFFISNNAELNSIIESCKKEAPLVVIIDSIQNIYKQDTSYSQGSHSQLKEIAFECMKLAKENNIIVIITGHITKEGNIAGPKLLEHMVDSVFYLETEEKWNIRILKSIKNRFGSIDETGFFKMESNGLTEIKNINEYLIENTDSIEGSTIISSIQGTRPILLELQTLTSITQYGFPQRIITGIDPKAVNLVAAILEKYLKIKFSKQDIFFKVSGGIKLKDNSAELGIALSLLSSYLSKPLSKKSIAIGELNLSGQIKPIQNFELHSKEAEKFGFENIIVAEAQATKKQNKTKIVKLATVYDLLKLFN